MRKIVITGAASGIGAVTAQLLRENGDAVVGIDVHNADIVADLSTRSGRKEAAARAANLCDDSIDAVIACAGKSTQSAVDVSVNFFGVVDLLDDLRPALSRAQKPRVAVVSSVTAIHDGDPDVVNACINRDEERAVALAQKAIDDGRGTGIYGSSKRALALWIREHAITDEWAGAGIALNAVAPGMVVTPMTAARRASEDQKLMAERAVPSKLGDWIQPEAVADCLIWLTRPANTNTTGQIIFVDGGAEAVIRGAAAF